MKTISSNIAFIGFVSFFALMRWFATSPHLNGSDKFQMLMLGMMFAVWMIYCGFNYEE